MKFFQNFSKTFIFIIAFSSLNLTSAQELTNEHKQMLKYDNTAYFAALVNKENINACYPIENNAYTLLGLAIKMNSRQVFQKLIDEKADVEKSCDGKTPLMFAAKYGNTELAKKLLTNGAKKDTKTDKGYTALDYARKYEKPEMIKLLE
ncbi:ankyrin repeat domain-containing protein [Chryseobacterium phosphatilyticum]|uniref:Ankyrin repeat domain-containing protein n=1 Tax=Chryseobacterium phosphatilyticum TaxID=475075 RepID=A0A316X841_9FLAO|nr:ankyrin repeat domain-containing protein [Chryseobacterium phosphatilyticum]PWN69925.1 ankyrin repeat domain-containing protein [Chryseobacterium phosphatilyticum]